jgi:hypothetical protein
MHTPGSYSNACKCTEFNYKLLLTCSVPLLACKAAAVKHNLTQRQCRMTEAAAQDMKTNQIALLTFTHMRAPPREMQPAASLPMSHTHLAARNTEHSARTQHKSTGRSTYNSLGSPE